MNKVNPSKWSTLTSVSAVVRCILVYIVTRILFPPLLARSKSSHSQSSFTLFSCRGREAEAGLTFTGASDCLQKALSIFNKEKNLSNTKAY